MKFIEIGSSLTYTFCLIPADPHLWGIPKKKKTILCCSLYCEKKRILYFFLDFMIYWDFFLLFSCENRETENITLTICRYIMNHLYLFISILNCQLSYVLFFSFLKIFNALNMKLFIYLLYYRYLYKSCLYSLISTF